MTINYHKIQSIYKRDKKTKRFIFGEYSIPEFELLKNITWVGTEKVDGMCLDVKYCQNNIIFEGKTDKAQLPKELSRNLNNFFLNKERFKTISNTFGNNNVEFLLEGYGPGINGGGIYRTDQGFVLFDIKVNYTWLDRKDIEDIACCLGLDIVPVVGQFTLDEAIKFVKKGFYSQWLGKFIAEGLVLRPKVELKRKNGDRIIVKIKHKDLNFND